MKRDSSINRQGSTIGGDGAVGITTTTANNNDGMINNNPQDNILRKATGDALEGGIIIANQNTTTYPTSVSEFDLSQDIYHRIDGRLIKVTRADYVAEAVAEAAAAVLPARSGASHFNKPKVSTVTTSPMSRSTPPLSKRATTGTATTTTTTTHTSNSTSLSHSASTPVISSTSSAAAAAAKPKKGLVRRMSSIMGKKK
jgi:hypothetical protein